MKEDIFLCALFLFVIALHSCDIRKDIRRIADHYDPPVTTEEDISGEQ